MSEEQQARNEKDKLHFANAIDEINRLKKEVEGLRKELREQNMCLHNANAVVDAAEREINKLKAERPILWAAARAGHWDESQPSDAQHYIDEYQTLADYDKSQKGGK